MEFTPLLIENGAEINAKDEEARTPMDEAIDEEHSEMQTLLRDNGGMCSQLC